ncbi:tRNA (N6-threonylcarbamoyladenosine(37)-N6)-methyltransferase TrmO [Methanobacterium alcaliphilum]|nr:tRNA (N6-threonylcarbamoyladenosine(37)-N6)-methyltransferase TrmO [Methanobacterium alcaliphilum]MCK9151187.1 tRNA (N6-threonylcarbamoyladenosine(37)-N6)-methyltransferase TrmO [Methanobacterium alcaliphilum]
MTLKPIGVIHSPFEEKSKTPHQGIYTTSESVIEVFKEYKEALDGIENVKNIHILYWCDKSERNLLKVIPHGKTQKRGVFSTRAPSRPNPIALSLVELIKIDDTKLTVKGLEALDGSLVVDIKPYWKDIDCVD